jgi:hypothetical protein
MTRMLCPTATRARRLAKRCGQPSALCREICVLRPGLGPGRLGQRSSHIDVTLAGIARQLFTRRLVVPWTHVGPRGKGASSRETRHVCADFRNQHFSHVGAHPWAGLEEVNGLRENTIGALVKLSLNFRGRTGNGPLIPRPLALQAQGAQASGQVTSRGHRSTHHSRICTGSTVRSVQSNSWGSNLPCGSRPSTQRMGRRGIPE